ncbi:MAG: transcriptional regulator, partial [Solirubrobacteraceae bacterium]
LSGQASEGFVRACSEVTRGNPLFLRELLLELAARGAAVNDAGAQEVRCLGPANVSRIVLRRVARLPAAARSLARAVAVLDERAELRYAAALSGLELSEAAGAADSLARVELLAQSGQRMQFVHPIVRAAIYAEMPTADRSTYHACAARLLDGEQAPVDQVVAHLVATLPCGDQWVVKTLHSAAGRALSQGTPDAAISYLRRALDEPPVRDALPDIVAALGVAELRARDACAVEHLQRALELTHPPTAEQRSRLTSAGR